MPAQLCCSRAALKAGLDYLAASISTFCPSAAHSLVSVHSFFSPPFPAPAPSRRARHDTQIPPNIPTCASPLAPSRGPEQNAEAPKSVRKGLGHINKALEEAQAADDSLNNQGLHAKDSASEEKKKEAIARKMRALTAQIQSDFKKVTGFGDKAGYLRPVLLVSLVVHAVCGPVLLVLLPRVYVYLCLYFFHLLVLGLS